MDYRRCTEYIQFIRYYVWTLPQNVFKFHIQFNRFIRWTLWHIKWGLNMNAILVCPHFTISVCVCAFGLEWIAENKLFSSANNYYFNCKLIHFLSRSMGGKIESVTCKKSINWDGDYLPDVYGDCCLCGIVVFHLCIASKRNFVC